MSSKPEHRSVTAPVPSPCTSVCKMDPSTGWCEGCLRTIDEIAAWATLSDADKLVIWDRLGERREQIEIDGSR
ncbi:MAG TPA: DUF1289 domain-containing protein [Burkholderiaceae bacterium]|nr:DUF1289 domain-containing protein [Burkholderiaceae bacterium]